MTDNEIKRTVQGVGYLGDGIYKASVKGKKTQAYVIWCDILRRCYNEKRLKKYPTYKGCTVCDEWHNFQNFAEWFYENYPKDGNRYDLDKDIKFNGNKVYGPETCIFVSHEKNMVKAHAKSYKAIFPEGKLFEFYNRREFCRKHNLNQGTFGMMIRGFRKQHKGWTRAHEGDE